MHFSLRHLWSVMILPLVVLSTPASAVDSAKDQKLAARLTTQQTFRTRTRDTFADLASILYGHAGWWEKIRDKNPSLSTYGENDRLPAGINVIYPAPVVGDHYVVQPGDYLIRIAAWKYGDMDAWEQLYRQNKNKISNPNLIRPGDVLELDASGRMVNRGTGQVVFDNLSSNGNSVLNRKPAVEGPPTAEATGANARISDAPLPPEETLATLLGLPPSFTVLGQTFDTAFALGFALGCLMLLILPLQWLIAKSRRRKVSADTSLPFHYEHPKDEEDDEMLEENSGHGFKKRPLELYRFDRSLIPSEKGEAAKNGGYHALSTRKKRKYLKRKAS